MSGMKAPGLGLGALSLLSQAQTRSISPENSTGEKGRGGMATEGTGAQAARDLGRGWKISPSIVVQPGTTVTLATIAGPGAIQHIWATTHARHWRELLLRMYWEQDERPAVERSGSSRTCARAFRRSAGAPVGVIFRFRTTSHRLPSGTRWSRHLHDPHHPATTTWK